MMKFISKYIFEIGAILLIIASYFLTRIYNIMSLPIFTDEAIYTRWAQIAYNDSAWRFISLTDGKQPSFIWLQLVMLRFFEDPLLAGRMVSVFTGFGTLTGVFLLTQILFKNRNLSILASLLYVIFPFALVYDKMALYDSAVAMFSVWALFFSVLLVRKLRLDVALVLGFILGGAVLTKSSGFLFIYLSPLLLILFDLRKKDLVRRFFKWVALLGISVFLAYFFYSILRLSPFFHIIEQKNSTFVYPFFEWVEHPFTYLPSNLSGMTDWVITYMTIPIVVLVFSSFVIEPKRYFREKALLFLWFLGPFMGLAIFGKLIYPRFIFFMTIPLLILSAYSLMYLITRVKQIYLKFLIIAVFTGLLVYVDVKILKDFENAPIAEIDLGQFIRGWPAGTGVRESVEFFEQQAKNKEIFIGTQGTFGLMPYSYEIYLGTNPNIEVVGYWPINDTIPEDVLEIARTKEAYFVYYQPCPQCEYPGAAPLGWPLEKIAEYKKADKNNTLTIYRVVVKD